MRQLRDVLTILALAGCCLWPWPARAEQACRVARQGQRVELQSPFFVLRLDTSAGLHAAAWQNRLTGRTISLGNGPELEFDIGLPGGPQHAPRLVVSKVDVNAQGEAAELVFQLSADEPAASVAVTYRWDAKQPVLRKFIQITNRSPQQWNRLLNVRLGTYQTDAKVVEKEQGFPLYLDNQCFMTLAHPAGWATGSGNQVSLRQFPGARLAPGKSFQCMETVLGAAQAGQARKSFIAYLQSRMRRIRRGHDKPYAIFEPFGARPNGDFNESEQFLLDNLAKVAQGQRQSGCHFDFYSVDFWADFHGDLKSCDPRRFPNGLTRLTAELNKLGTAPGLWIDSGGFSGGAWSVGGNPAVKACFSREGGKGGLCRASEPVKSMYTEAFRAHIRQHGMRLLKFDNLLTSCSNPAHEHLPGVYSTESIDNALIEFLHALDAECPDVFLMLYWGYRSPWWLLHADTLFDSGIGIEAASPSDQPAPYARDSVTQKLDQAQWTANANIPALGKDSLGVWLSNWRWNSQTGKERWQGGFIMDLCRGSLLAQPWSDTPWLSPPERAQMAEWIALLKAQPGCFRNSRFVLGDPWKDQPYGYCCTDGKRAFLALHNCCWKDSRLRLELNSAWGLLDGQAWDLYRWYPDPARLTGDEARFGGTASLTLRPFQIVLLEVVPRGQAPTLNRRFEPQPLPAFAEPSRPLEVAVRQVCPPKRDDQAVWKVLDPVRFTSAGGATLRKLPDGSILAGGENPSPDTYTMTAHTDFSEITGFRLEALPDPSLPALGPGRASNGNFALNEFRVAASPQGGQGKATLVKLRNPAADFSQDSYGGWPVVAALDGDPKTGWSIDPLEGRSHVAVFETEKPLRVSGGATLQFVLQQGSTPGHNLGRLRLSATAAKPPWPLPKTIGLRSLAVTGQVPASSTGGMLVISVQMTRGTQPMRVGGPGKYLTAQGTLGGETVVCKPVLGTATYPSCWQAWRIAVEPSARPQPFELMITAAFGPDIQFASKGHFLPQ
jgi:hypothetical protein